MYPTPNELSSYSPAWPCAHFRLAGGVNALAGVLLPFIRSGMEYIGPQGQRKDSEFDGMLMVIVYVTSYSRWRGFIFIEVVTVLLSLS